MKAKPAGRAFNLPWNVRDGGGMVIEDANGVTVASTWTHLYAPTQTQRKRAAKYAAFIVEAANATIKGEKP